MLARMLKLPNAAIVVFLALMLAGCQTQLAPAFDQSLVDGLTTADKQTLVLFSAVSAGSAKDKFPDFANRYDELIGTFGSLQNRAQARPTPPFAKKLADQLVKFDILKSICSAEGDPGACVNSTPSALKEIVKILSKMRDQHENKGLKKDIVTLFKGGYDISINQAMTVEAALKRAQ